MVTLTQEPATLAHITDAKPDQPSFRPVPSTVAQLRRCSRHPRSVSISTREFVMLLDSARRSSDALRKQVYSRRKPASRFHDRLQHAVLTRLASRIRTNDQQLCVCPSKTVLKGVEPWPTFVWRGGLGVAQFEIFKDVQGKFRFRFQANNNEIVATSEGYNSKESAKHGIAVIQQQAATASVVDKAGY